MPDRSVPDKSAPPPPEVIEVTARRVACDGGGVLGHPRVWMTIPFDSGWVDCGYCDRRFVLRGEPAPDH